MIFFDFLYYSIYRFYSAYKEKGAASTSAGIVGGLQAMNILTAIMVFQCFVRQKVHLDKLLVVAFFIFFQITTYIRYIHKDTHSVDVMERKWSGKTEITRKQISVALFLYGALSIIAFFGLAIYLGSGNYVL